MKSITCLTCAAALAVLILGAAPTTSQAQGTYRFCNYWRYSWNDEPGNQDHLSHVPGSTGNQAARYTWYNVLRNGSMVSQGYAGLEGCVNVPALAGNYIVRLYGAVSNGSKSFYIYSNTSEVWEAFDGTGYLPGIASGTQQWNVYFASGTGVGNMAAIAANTMSRPSMGLKNGKTYKAYVDQNCPSGGFSACFSPATQALYLGNHNGQRRIFTKHVVGHELGHHVSYHLPGGPQNGFYGSDGCTAGYNQPDTCTLPQECQCLPHVVSSNAVHCLQSREFMNDAAQEGWAHFYATALFNEGSNPGSFTYYKEFYTFGGVIPPPLLNYDVVSSPVAWLEAFCLADGVTTNRGTQLDWQWFFYNLHRLTPYNKYSLDDISTVYANAASGGSSTWSQLVSSAATSFPGAKGALWQTMGDLHGVNH